MDTLKPRVERFAGVAASGALLLGVLAACASGGGGGGGETPLSPTQFTEGTPTDPLETTGAVPTEEETDMPGETPFLDPSMGSDKPDSNAAMTITGTIEPGVESGCLVMTYDGAVYGIFGQFDRAVVHTGAEVTLRGYLDHGMVSFCQQGIPFVVEEAEPAG